MPNFYDRFQLNRNQTSPYPSGLAEESLPQVIDKSTIYDGPAINTGGDSFLGGLDMGKLGDFAGLAGGLANTFAGFKQLGLAEDAFNFNKGMKEKEYAMAKDAYDRNVARAKSVGDQMRAGKVG